MSLSVCLFVSVCLVSFQPDPDFSSSSPSCLCLKSSWLAPFARCPPSRTHYQQASEEKSAKVASYSKHCQRHNGLKTLSTLTHLTHLVQSRSLPNPCHNFNSSMKQLWQIHLTTFRYINVTTLTNPTIWALKRGRSDSVTRQGLTWVQQKYYKFFSQAYSNISIEHILC